MPAPPAHDLVERAAQTKPTSSCSRADEQGDEGGMKISVQKKR